MIRGGGIGFENVPVRSNIRLENGRARYALYPECGNDQWYAVVNYTGDFGTEYRMTLFPEGTLVVQNYWEMDVAPMVGYEYFRRSVE